MNRRIYASLVLICMATGLLLAHAAIAALSFTGSQVTTVNVSNDGTPMTDIDIAALGTSDWACWTNVGAATQQKAGGSAIGDLQQVGDMGPRFDWQFTSFIWGSGGDPLETSVSPGFAAGVASATPQGTPSALGSGEGWRVDIALPGTDGTLTFWGVSRNASNVLTIEYGGDVLYSDSYFRNVSQWDVTTFTMNWEGAIPGDVITLKWLWSGVGLSTAARVGLTGIAASISEPFPLVELQWANDASVSNITATAAEAGITLLYTNAQASVFWGTINATTNLTWSYTNAFDANLSTGRVDGVAITNLNADTRYYYIFYATNSVSGDTAWSATGRSFNTALTGKSVTDLTATPAGIGINLAWTDNFATETGYVIQRSSSTPVDWQPLAVVAANSEFYMDISFAYETAYAYRIAATNAAGLSDWSAQVNVTSPAEPTYVITTNTWILENPPTVSSTDLLQTVVTNKIEVVNASVLYNGSLTGNMAHSNTGDFIYWLDTSVNWWGYDITGLDMYTGWSDRALQHYRFYTSSDGGATFTLIAEVNVPEPAEYYLRSSLSDGSGGALAQGVDVIKIENVNGRSMWREWDVLGIPTQPPPTIFRFR